MGHLLTLLKKDGVTVSFATSAEIAQAMLDFHPEVPSAARASLANYTNFVDLHGPADYNYYAAWIIFNSGSPQNHIYFFAVPPGATGVGPYNQDTKSLGFHSSLFPCYAIKTSASIFTLNNQTSGYATAAISITVNEDFGLADVKFG